MKYILAFSSTNKVLKAESVLKKKDISFRLDPAPSLVSAYCNLGITVDGETLEGALKTLKNSGPQPSAVYRKEGDRYVKV
ncbi:MAG: DUF3343 domain-containing protein [Deltaproteobacteria bacterium]|nr:DUF3343 domain-containing protein [Deltaproteobacteria bacterium]